MSLGGGGAEKREGAFENAGAFLGLVHCCCIISGSMARGNRDVPEISFLNSLQKHTL